KPCLRRVSRSARYAALRAATGWPATLSRDAPVLAQPLCKSPRKVGRTECVAALSRDVKRRIRWMRILPPSAPARRRTPAYAEHARTPAAQAGEPPAPPEAGMQ